MGIYVYIYALCYTVETNTTLLGNYTPIKKLKKKKKAQRYSA